MLAVAECEVGHFLAEIGKPNGLPVRHSLSQEHTALMLQNATSKPGRGVRSGQRQTGYCFSPRDRRILVRIGIQGTIRR